MPRFLRRTPIAAPAETLDRWHERPGAFTRLSPPWQDVTLVRHDGIDEGDRAEIRLGVGPASLKWTAEHIARTEGRGFEDVQLAGPFADWHHRHRFLPVDDVSSILEDEVTYRLPFGPLSAPARPFARRELARMFAYRHRVTKSDVERHYAAGLAPMTVAVTGSTGLVGEALVAFLQTGGHRVVRLLRSREAILARRAAGEDAVYWNVDEGTVDRDALAANAPDAVVHLAGEPVYALRWTNAKKRAIWESRTKGTQLLAAALAGLDRPPRVLLSASATGYYGDRGSARLTEDDAPGDGFLADLTQAWENSTAAAEAAGIRTVHLRIGLVLSPAGGLLKRVLPVFLAGLGGHLAAGRRFLPWIALDDLLYAVLHLLGREDIEGPVNLTGPVPVTGKRFARALGSVLRRPAFVPVPKPLIALAAGEFADEALFSSARVLPQRLLESDFTFAYPAVDLALRHLLGKSTAVPLQPSAAP